MATKRKICEEESEAEVGKKTPRMEDRLHSLPDCLQLHILSFLDVKQAVQTSVLSRTWFWLWNSMPVLDLNYIAFDKLPAFDKFVGNVLRYRDQSAKLNRLTFTRRGICSAKILKKVLHYAFSHDVEQLEVIIQQSRKDSWPVCLHTSSDSLKSLKLQSYSLVSCPFLGPRSGSFKNLTVMHLKRALINNLEPFSSFPMLEKLILQDCLFSTNGKILSLHAPQLSDLTISGYGCFSHCELTTPKLRFFEYQGSAFPLFQTHHGLPVLDTMVIGFTGACYHMHEKRMFDDLLSLFRSLHNAKSITLFSSIVDLLSLFPEKLVNTDTPFRNLKCLNLDFRSSYESFEIPSDVKAYLLHNSPEAKFTMIYPKSFKCITSCKC